MDILSEINKAVSFAKEKNYAAAERIYLKILRTDKNNSVVLSLLGLLYMNSAFFKRAERYLERADKIKKSPVTTEALGIVKSHLGKDREAVKYFEQIIGITKSYETYDRYIKSLIALKYNSKAHEYALKQYENYPLKADALNNVAFSAINAGKIKEAYSYSLQMTNLFPKYADGWLTLGIVTEMLYHDDARAEVYYKNAIRLGAKSAGYYNLVVSYDKRMIYDKAMYYAKKLAKLYPNDISVQFLLAHIYLRQRKFKKGIRYYVNYITEHSMSDPNNPLKNIKRLWDGKKYKKETVFVYCDQGVGDCLMFGRYIPYLQDYFDKIKVMVSPKIIELYKRSFGHCKNIKFYELSRRFPRYDKSVILSTLPCLIKMSFDNIPFSDKYIVPDSECVKKYSNIIKSDKLKVGICWEAGGIGWRELINRTLNISLYEPFLNLKDIQFYSLQVNPAMDNYKDYKNLIDLGSGFKSFDDTAGAMMNLDLVISVDTSVAHLAGSMGVKTFMLLPYCPDWRWFDNDKTTEWYDSLKIFKQVNPMSWDDVVNNIALELKKLTEG